MMVTLVCLSMWMAIAPATLPADVDALVDRLSSPAQADRVLAEDMLVVRGKLVREKLAGLVGSASSPETRNRLASAIRRIDEAGLSEPTLVALPEGEMSVDDAIADVAAKMFGQKIQITVDRTSGGDPATYRSDGKPTKGLELLAKLCRQSGRSFGSDPRVVTIRTGQRSPPIAVAGPVLLQAESASRTTRLDFGGDTKDEDSVSVSFRLIAEPRLLEETVGGLVTYFSVVRDAEGRAVSEPLPRGMPPMPGMRHAVATLSFAARDVKPPLSVDGVVRAFRCKEKILIDEELSPDKPIRRAVGTSELTVTTERPDPSRLKLIITLAGDLAGDAREAMRSRPFDPAAEIKVGSGDSTSWKTHGYSSELRNGKTTVTIEYTADRTPDSESVVRLVWNYRVRGEPIELPFHFDAIDLPK